MALGWAKHASDTSNEPAFLDTYANLLYKSGNKEEAIATQEKAVAITKEKGEDAEELQSTLDKMKKGVKTW
jgi:hypothetical protein